MKLTLLAISVLQPAVVNICTTSDSPSDEARCSDVLPFYRDNKQILNTFNMI